MAASPGIGRAFMSRWFDRSLAAFVVLGGIVTASTLVWSNTARSPGSQTFAGIDFEHAFGGATAHPRRLYVPAFLTMIDFQRQFTGGNALARREYVPVLLTAVEFERSFASVTAARRGNTPPNREKLRNAGWKRILGTG
jgi:hypothetical protein